MIHLSAKTIYAPIAVAALLIASCTNDNEPMATDPNAIAFQTSVQTRAVKESHTMEQIGAIRAAFAIG